ncbi:PrpF domain-containing protein [Streptomyces spiralis]|uniref:PrpF domain-containing protein n=1 Tax=Streptomyces spiralis TaxID=66376 RepID=UPI0034114E24
MAQQLATPMAFYRGGTSKAVVIDRRDVPANDERELAAWILAAYGSPDARQIDGVGGADPLTSKFAVVGPPTRPGADVDYTFYQVFVDRAVVSKDMNCGNISSAVGPYAIEQGYVEAPGDAVTVAVHATNFDQMLHITVRTADGQPEILGSQAISGVPGTGSPIEVDFHETVGTHGLGLLPTGNTCDRIDVAGVGTVEVSIIDLANLIVFARAEDFGLSGTENPDELSDDGEMMGKLENLRKIAGIKVGLAADLDDTTYKCALSPFLALVAEPRDWTEYGSGHKHRARECDFLAFSTLDGVVHKAYMVSGSTCTAVAAFLPGTVVNKAAGVSGSGGRIRIGHPSGTVEVEAAIDKHGDSGFTVTRAALVRTARRLMDGHVYTAADRLPWRDEAGDLPPLQIEHPGPRTAVHNEVYHRD